MKKFKNITLSALITHLIITLIYPFGKALLTDGDKLLVFLDTLTILSLLYIAFGVFYRLVLKGDFDRISFSLKRSLTPEMHAYEVEQKNKKEKRSKSFNYPLWLGIIYLILCVLAGKILY